jgi:hypothetical protein
MCMCKAPAGHNCSHNKECDESGACGGGGVAGPTEDVLPSKQLVYNGH